MSATTVPKTTLDLRGLASPEPLMRLADARAGWAAGDTVRIVADDDCFTNDFLRWSAGCELEKLSLRYLAGGETELVLRVPACC
jgi:TusA-related sulfurtransferase